VLGGFRYSSYLHDLAKENGGGNAVVWAGVGEAWWGLGDMVEMVEMLVKFIFAKRM
jgi:hypothetical protein